VGGVMMIVAGLSLGLAVYDSGAARWLAWVLLGQITWSRRLRPFVIGARRCRTACFLEQTVTATITSRFSSRWRQTWTPSVALRSRPRRSPRLWHSCSVTEGDDDIISVLVGYFSYSRHGEAESYDIAPRVVALTQYVERSLAFESACDA